MTTDGMGASTHQTRSMQQRFGQIVSSWTMRILVAFIISWLIVLAFFVSGAVSH